MQAWVKLCERERLYMGFRQTKYDHEPQGSIKNISSLLKKE